MLPAEKGAPMAEIDSFRCAINFVTYLIHFIRRDRAAVPCARDDGDAGGHRVLLRLRRQAVAHVSYYVVLATTYVLLLLHDYAIAHASLIMASATCHRHKYRSPGTEPYEGDDEPCAK